MRIRKNFRECGSCQHVEDWSEEDEYIFCELEREADSTEEIDEEEAWKEEFGKICPQYKLRGNGLRQAWIRLEDHNKEIQRLQGEWYKKYAEQVGEIKKLEQTTLRLFVELERLRFTLQELVERANTAKALLGKMPHAHLFVDCGCGQWSGCIICQGGYCPKCNHYLKNLTEIEKESFGEQKTV